ncbi:caspase family protein [Leptolyngbyaceae cyanobacterium JSC-12]|nr:caspase family protein [Leptolyngbyaceae cyanobacterium JSC-12]
MSLIKRRHFLQFAGSTLATMGLSQLDIFRQGDRYASVLAQSTPRKLALLVGINQYTGQVPSLRGCLMDIDLQRELLVHRYGFNPKDVLVVGDGDALKPNRETILKAFETHLIQQAKPGDVVVFHFSGHGSLVQDPDPLPELILNQNGEKKVVPNRDRVNGTMVPSERSTGKSDQVQDIMGRTLFLLTQALQTDNVTVVLDCCHSGGGTRGNLQFRAIPSRLGSNLMNPSVAELEYQKRWMQNLKLSGAQFAAMRQKGIAKGVAIGSANYDQLAADAPFDNSAFYAGAFTYLLTRYLWQQSVEESIGTVFVNLARATRDVAQSSGVAQEPIFAVNPERNRQQPTYFLKPTTPFAEAVVQMVQPNGIIEYWLGGISSRSLAANQKGTLFSVLDATGKEVALIEQERRTMLVGFGKLKTGTITSVQPGSLLRERIRGLHSDFKLRLGLDVSLEKDLETIRAVLSTVDRIQLVSSNEAMNYRLGRMTSSYQTLARSQSSMVPPVNSFGVFTAGLKPLNGTFGEPGESATEAVTRLLPRLRSWLAVEILKTIGGTDGIITGGNSSGITVEVTAAGTTGGRVAPNQFKPGTEIQIKLRNSNPSDRYVAVLAIGSAGNLRVLFPYFDAPEEAARVFAGREYTLPEPGVRFPLSQTPGGLEILVLASGKPVRDALLALRDIAARGGVSSSRSISPQPMQGEDAIATMTALLGSIDRNTRSDISVASDVQAVDTRQITVSSTAIEVVPG